jgi:hypothetical protein
MAISDELAIQVKFTFLNQMQFEFQQHLTLHDLRDNRYHEP